MGGGQSASQSASSFRDKSKRFAERLWDTNDILHYKPKNKNPPYQNARQFVLFAPCSLVFPKVPREQIQKTSIPTPFAISLSHSPWILRGNITEPFWHSVHLHIYQFFWIGAHKRLEAARMPNWLCKFLSEKPSQQSMQATAVSSCSTK